MTLEVEVQSRGNLLNEHKLLIEATQVLLLSFFLQFFKLATWGDTEPTASDNRPARNNQPCNL